MTLVRVRRQGNSAVVTLTQEVLEKARLNDGDLIQQTVDARGRIVIEPVTVRPRVSEKMGRAIRSAARDKRPVLRRLAEHDRD